MMHLTFVQKFAVWVLPVLFAITVHEVAHGFVASKLGDKTAQILGRLTLNPLKHIDLVGTVFVPLLLLWLGGILFGWAKPVPINPRNLKHPRRDMIWVALAGPISNLLMAFFWAFVAMIAAALTVRGFSYMRVFVLMGQAGIWINWILMVLNLIPIPPLDGSRVVSGLLPPKTAYQYERIEPYGFFILLLLIITGVFGFILMPSFHLMQFIFQFTGLPLM